ncbi:aspartyl-tRNA synthetase 2, mitochondrial [Clonorchis sinensis]|uniref:Aspartyl-tRNA synthetase 2, mitochondrial n=1 Tax=Clonorchis sinensis TaxID=79923 RepID=A0A8T1MJT1_CLOSI|nr:aspartyl-tRNA synthetase 2, mitochondrial [Clonorchis sinensis]
MYKLQGLIFCRTWGRDIINSKAKIPPFSVTAYRWKSHLLDFVPDEGVLDNRVVSIRSHTCGELRLRHVSETVSLCGWVHRIRLSKFLILRDKYGLVQVFLGPGVAKDPFPPVETVVRVVGTVAARPSKDTNKDLPTGQVEVVATRIDVLNLASPNLPFGFNDENVNEHLRLSHRYLDLRSTVLQRNLKFRSDLLLRTRQFLCHSCGFVEVETPYLFRRTPGGAREFIAPTAFPGLFYSLPQSPQQFKQLLMIGGVDRYMQIARCFRDEPSRADRQPEFTQLDLELSFCSADDVLTLIEKLLRHLWPLVEEASNAPLLRTPFPRISYADALSYYGTDKPDSRFDFTFCLPTADGTIGFRTPGIRVSALESGDWANIVRDVLSVTGVRVSYFEVSPGCGDHSALVESLEADPGETIVFVQGSSEKKLKALGLARTHLAAALDSKGVPIYQPGFHFLWVHDFPLFERTEAGTWESVHHPFTAPTPETLEFIYTDPGKVIGQHYDLVCNGQEIGGGSIRIHDGSLQEYVLSTILGEDTTSMDYFIKALNSGAPPHGGIALGLDRLFAILLNAKTIRDVIAFPKVADGKDLMCGAPAIVSDEDLAHYKLAITK